MEKDFSHLAEMDVSEIEKTLYEFSPSSDGLTFAIAFRDFGRTLRSPRMERAMKNIRTMLEAIEDEQEREDACILFLAIGFELRDAASTVVANSVNDTFNAIADNV